jgi:hypothetical protein
MVNGGLPSAVGCRKNKKGATSVAAPYESPKIRLLPTSTQRVPHFVAPIIAKEIKNARKGRSHERDKPNFIGRSIMRLSDNFDFSLILNKLAAAS